MPLERPYDDDATTDFEFWLKDEAPRDLKEAIDLRDAVRHEQDQGRYTAERDYEFLIIEGSEPEKLIIASSDAKTLFLQIVHQQYIVPHRKAPHRNSP